MAIVLTEKAADQIKEVQSDPQFQDEPYLRIQVLEGGCSGFQYSMGFDSNYDIEQDNQYDCHGVKVVVNKKMALFLDGTTIDWIESPTQRGFAFDNPNVPRGGCGCNGGSCH